MSTPTVSIASSFTSAYGVDVFISYGHIDNQEAWVTHFHSRLETRLQELLGSLNLVIWRDRKLDGVEDFEERLRKTVRDSAVFISVLSPRYVASVSCRKELDWFMNGVEQTGGLRVDTQSRLIRVVKTRLVDGAEPPNFKATLGYEFYEADPQNPANFREFDSEPGMPRFQLFRDRCDNLAQAVARLLLKMKRDAPAVQANTRTVFLARTTSDLASRLASVRSELAGRGHTVLPDEPLPESGPELRAAVDALLARSDVSVHLIGRSYGVIPELETTSFGDLQFELAREHHARPGFHQLAWIPEDLQNPEERQQNFLAKVRAVTGQSASNGADVYETCFESFKEGLLDVLSRKPEAPVLPQSGRAKAVYLMCDQPDLKRDELHEIQAYLRSRGHPVELPPFQGEPEELREAEEELIADTDAALIYYGSAKDIWVLRKRKNLLKVLSKKETGHSYARALYVCSPKDEIKSGNYLSVAGHVYPEGNGFCPLLVLGDCEEFRPEKLDAFVTMIEQGSSC